VHSLLALALLAAVQAAPPDSLLPPPPAGWRSERLDLPLDFAPELAYRGVEDLLFAPGMFEPGSDSYFSYALALRLEGDVGADAAMLDGFLTTYYRGLCRAVGESRGLERDPETVTASVRRAGAGFVARVELYDPFNASGTGGGDLDLVLEITVRDGERATEILGLASPLDPDAPVWAELHALGDAWRAARPAPVGLNHVYLVVDEATYGALAASDFLRERFAVGEERTTVRRDLSYSGLYLYAGSTYFEFLPPTPAAGLVEGASGLALGVDETGGLAALERALAGRGVPAAGGPVTRELDGVAVPWFAILGVEMPAGTLSLFAMEYDPGFLAGWHAGLPPEGPSVARADVLARYAASLDRTDLRERAPLVDVREVHVALDEAQRERLLAVCAAAGHAIERAGDAWFVLGPGFRLRIEGSDEPGGVVGLELALRAPLERAPLRLGRIELSFAGDTATLRRVDD